MSDITYEIVSDDLRTAARQTEQPEWVKAALEGETIRVNLTQTKLGGYYKTFSKQGFKLRTRADGDHTILWAERIETAGFPEKIPVTVKK